MLFSLPNIAVVGVSRLSRLHFTLYVQGERFKWEESRSTVHKGIYEMFPCGGRSKGCCCCYLHIKEYIGHVLVYITLKETFLLFFPLFLGGWKWSFRENSYGEIRVFMKKISSHDEIDFLLTNTRTMMWKMRNFVYIYMYKNLGISGAVFHIFQILHHHHHRHRRRNFPHIQEQFFCFA